MSVSIIEKLLQGTGTWHLSSDVPPLSPSQAAEKVLPLELSIASKADSSNMFSTFTHQGGLVLENPVVYNIFLGNKWSNEPQRMERLNLFTVDLLKSSVVDVMKQYGYVKGNFIKSFVLSTTVGGTTYIKISESVLALIIQNAINKKMIPEPDSQQVCFMIYLSDELSVYDDDLGVYSCGPNNNTAFGFHHYFKTAAGNEFIYAIMPSLTDACVKATCMSSPTCAMSLTQTQEERITQVAAHEYTEMVTNPTGRGWYDTKSGEEIADVCNGGSTYVEVGANKWNMQTQYSLHDDKQTSGRLSCVSSPVSTTPIQALQRLSNQDIIKLLSFAGLLMLVSGIAYRYSR